jgi:integrase
MAELGVTTSITVTALKRFIATANEGQELSCDVIKGFGVRKNRNPNSASFRYRPSVRHASRVPITIGKVNAITLADAAKIALEMMQAINEGNDPKDVLRTGSVAKATRVVSHKQNDPSLLGVFFQQVYLPARRRSSGKGAYQDEVMVRREFSHLFNKPMNKLTSKDITSWQDQKEKQGLSYLTVVRYYTSLISVLSMAVKLSHESGGEHAGLLFDMPFKIRPLRGASKAQKDALLTQEREIDIHVRRMLNDEELLKIEAAMNQYAQEFVAQRERSLKHSNRHYLPSLVNVVFPHWIQPYIYIAYYTGLRPGDISDLKWQDFHEGRLHKVTNKSKHLVNPVVVKLGLSATKSVLKYSLAEVIEIWREQQGNPKSGWVFPQIRDESKPLSEKGYKKSWAKITEYAGLKLHMYSFRHNFISRLVREGVNLKMVATMAGHKSTEMIEKHYAHHFPSDIDAAMSIF